MNSRTFFFSPEDLGGTGAGTETPTPAATTVPADAIKAVANEIRMAIEAGRNAVPAPVAAPTDHQGDAIRALEAEGDRVAKDFDALCAEGRFAEGQALMTRFQQKVNRTVQGDGNSNPTVKVAVALGEKVARAENKDLMTKWGDEIRRAVDALPIEERVLPDAWDKAISKVKTNHFDEILAEQVNVKVEEARRTFTPPPSASGSRGRALDGAASKLDEAQLYAADLCGVSPDDYLKSLKFEEEYLKLPVKERGPFGGIPVLNEAPGAAIVPGKF